MMDRPSYQRWASSTEQRPLRILSLDGGGVRGYSTLLLLQELMHKLFVEIEGRAPEAWELPKPCDHFDLIVGTGTGGLIAILLGRLRIDVATALEFYADISKYIFQEDKTFGGIPYGKTLYKASRLEEATKEVVGKYDSNDINGQRKKTTYSPSINSSSSPSLRKFRFSFLSPSQSPIPVEDNEWKLYADAIQIGENALWYDDRPGRCKTFVTARYKGSSPNAPPAILRTYSSAAESCPVGQKCTIWEIARATCAVQPAFKAIQIGQNIFLDEGGGKLNPSLFALEEAIVNEWPGREVGIFISVGTCRVPSNYESLQRVSSFRSAITGVTPLRKFAVAAQTHQARVKECEQFHLNTLKMLRESGFSEDIYFRLNVDEKVDFNFTVEWTMLASISNATRAYLAKGPVQQMNKNAARRLAGIWRMDTKAGKSVDRLPLVPIPGVYVGQSVNDVPETYHYSSQPIVPNLASEFGKLNPPYVLPQHSRESPKTTDNTLANGDPASSHLLQQTPSNCSPFSPLPPISPYFPMTITPSTTPPPTFPNPPTPSTNTTIDTETTSSSTSLSCRLPLILPRLSSLLPPREQMSFRLTDPNPDDLKIFVQERLPLLESPSSASSGSPSSSRTTCNSSAWSVTDVAEGIDIQKSMSGMNINDTASPKTAGSCWNSQRGAEISGVRVRTPQKWEREGRDAGVGVVGVGVEGVGIVGVDGMHIKPYGSGSGSGVEDVEDSEIALHFEELYKIAGHTEHEAGLAGQRGYYV